MEELKRNVGKSGKTSGVGAFFVCLGSEKSDSSYV
jgi:hypothetical protein